MQHQETPKPLEDSREEDILMKNFSNRYMLLYALAIAAVVAILLTVVATGLKERQQNNIRNEKMQMLLATIGIQCDRNEAYHLFSEHFEEVDNNEIGTDGNPLHYYLFNKDGEHGYVIPVQGRGLWGKIYANIALTEDLNTIVGITFSHDGETPGLGAEITSDAFCRQFIGKKILDDEGNVVSVSVIKHADNQNPHQVDAISGSTMTSNGVNDMLMDELSKYADFIRKEVCNEQ